jgi:hypothetical protein
MWKFEFEAPAGTRVLSRGFWSITHFHEKNRWWCYKQKRWTNKYGDEGATSGYYCRSFKAFKRHLRKHPELKECGEITLVSRFMGYDVKARWVEPVSTEMKPFPPS